MRLLRPDMSVLIKKAKGHGRIHVRNTIHPRAGKMTGLYEMVPLYALCQRIMWN